MNRLNDISLATQVAVFHNRQAFDKLVREYQSPVRRFFLTQTNGNEALSDDLAQETFIKAYTHISQYRGTSGFLTWLIRIAYNLFYDYKRKTAHVERKNGEQYTDTVITPAVQGHTSSAIKMDISSALAILKEEERMCITLQLIDGYDVADISKITQMKEGTVKSHLHRGKTKLANYLRQNGYDR